MRSVEFAVSDVKEYKWIGYEKAYSSQDISDTTDDGKPSNRETGMTHSSENIPDKRENGKPETSEEISDQYVNEKLTDSRNPILLGWLNLCSL